jgi:hyperosmotically inducible protein
MKMIHIGLLLVISCFLLTGCAALAVGGAGAGGYHVANDKRTFQEMTADARITSSVNTEYLKDDLVQTMNIDVDTHRGVVTLHGMVDNQEEATRAIDIALEHENVTAVVSNLVIRNQALSPRGVVYRKSPPAP